MDYNLELDSMDMNMSMSCNDMTMKMQMTFYNDKEFMLYLYDWHIRRDESYGYTLVLLFLFSVLIEFSRTLLMGNVGEKYGQKFGDGVSGRLIRGSFKTVVYFLIICGAYLLMLAVMTYSTGIFVVVCIGTSTGYTCAKALENPPSNTKESHYSMQKMDAVR